MYEIGDRVVYGIHGVCQILCQEEQRVDRKKVLYYVLEPLEKPGARFYVPAHNQVALSKLQPVLDRQMLDALLHSEAVRQDPWIEDENQRKLRYRELINTFDRAALIAMVVSLRRHREAQAAAGRKFHLSDDNFLRDAEKMLNGEFSLVLQIPADQVQAYILNALQ